MTRAARPVRRRGAAALTLVLTGALVGVGVPAAQAAPGDDELREARAAVRSTASAIADLELRLATQGAAVDSAWTAVEAAGESYTQALADRDEAADDARAAADRHAAAQVEMEEARSGLGRIAVQAYRSGGSMDSLGAFLTADGFEDLVERTEALDRLGRHADRAVQRFQAADLVTRTLAGRADDAAREASEAASAAEDALEEAESAQAAAQEQERRTTAERDRLITELADLRETTVQVERERQDRLDARRAAREEAAAAADRGVDRTPPPTQPGSGSGSTGQDPAPSNPAPSNPAPSNPAPSNPQPSNPPDSEPEPSTPPPSPSPTPSQPPAPKPPSDPYGLGTGSQRGSAAQGRAAVAWAVAQVGKDYGWGATGPNAFDCSGLTSQAWRAAGVSINRTSRDQFRQVRKVRYSDMRPGDLIFYGGNTADPGSITHVAMFVGNGQMVEAPRAGVPVRVTSIRWSRTMLYAGRP